MKFFNVSSLKEMKQEEINERNDLMNENYFKNHFSKILALLLIGESVKN